MKKIPLSVLAILFTASTTFAQLTGLKDREKGTLNNAVNKHNQDLDNAMIGIVDAAQRRVPFDHSTFPETYLLTLNAATHMTFVPRTATEKYEPFISESTLAFWDAFLKHNPAAKTWLEKDFSTDLAATGTFEQKPSTAKP